MVVAWIAGPALLWWFGFRRKLIACNEFVVAGPHEKALPVAAEVQLSILSPKKIVVEEAIKPNAELAISINAHGMSPALAEDAKSIAIEAHPPTSSSQTPSALAFQNISYFVGERTILSNVSGFAQKGARPRVCS